MSSKMVYFVTGGASGLGRAVATRFAGKGGRVIIADLPSSNGEAVANELGSDNVLFHPTDVSTRCSTFLVEPGSAGG